MTLKDEETVEWIVIPVNGVTPGKRYGHTISFVKPNIVLFGGNNGSLVLNDVWTLQVNQTPFTWKKVNFDVSCPPARVYHSASLCQSGSTKGMIVIFGGRGSDQKPLNDIWGLRKHRTGNWDWVQAPCKNDIIPFPRYQVIKK
jgi:protein phosphatase